MRTGISIFVLALCASFAVTLPVAAQTNAVPDDPDFVLDLGPEGAGTAAGPGAATEAGPSYNCRYAKLPAEIAICDSPELSGLDRTMSNIYFSKRNSLTGNVRRELQQFQRQWLRQRNGCGYDPHCLRQSYLEQIRSLRRWPQ